MELSQKYTKVRPLFYFLIIAYVAIISILIYKSGLLYFTDTVSYLEMANRINKGEFPHSSSFSPGYPFLVFLISKTLSVSASTSLYVINIILALASSYILYYIIRACKQKSETNFHESVLMTFVLMINWLLIKIVLTAHADILFFFFLNVYFLLLIKWIKTFDTKWLIAIAVIAALSVWVKYNSIILVPFLLIVSLVYGRRKINYFILLLPVIFVVFSFYLFKVVNGTVIEHFQGDSIITKIEKSFTNLNLFYTNLSSSGRVYFSSVFSKSIELLIPHYIGIVFMILVISLLIKTFIFRNEINRIENIFLLFSLYYWFCFFSLCQYTEWEELNSRTLFPSILSFLLWIILSYKNVPKRSIKLMNAAAILSICYSFIYVFILIYSDKSKFTNYLIEFEKKPVVVQLKEIQFDNNVEYRIYSNESRNLSYAMNFTKINEIPSKRVFTKGKFREKNEIEYEKLHADFCEEFKKNNTAILIFNNPLDKPIDSALVFNASNIYRFKNDVLIVHSTK